MARFPIAIVRGGGEPSADQPRRSAVHWLALALVWMAVVSGAVVFAEPAPVDILTLMVIGLLPLIGLVRITRGLVLFWCLWMLAGASAFLSTIAAPDLFLARAATHTGISIYLYLAMFVFAGFVAHNPTVHGRLIMGAYLWSTSIAAAAGLVGYFALVPGAEELFTKFARASGTFKDPNVFGAFLVPGAVYALHLTVTKPLRRALVPAALLAIVSLAILLSFSRGAWVNLAVAMAIYGYLAFVLATSNLQRVKLATLAVLTGAVALIGVIYALQSPDVGRLLEERASLTQSYDEGPEGRFGGQEKAKRLIADNPMGIGPLVFTEIYHVEDVHNVYLSMFLNAGWIGGFLYLVLVAVTCLYGLNHALERTATQPLFLVVYAAFVAQVLEGVVIDTDHWRHFYLLMGLVWGLMVAARPVAVVRALERRPRLVQRPAFVPLDPVLASIATVPARPIVVIDPMRRVAAVKRRAHSLSLKRVARRSHATTGAIARPRHGRIVGIAGGRSAQRQRPATIRGLARRAIN